MPKCTIQWNSTIYWYFKDRVKARFLELWIEFRASGLVGKALHQVSNIHRQSSASTSDERKLSVSSC